MSRCKKCPPRCVVFRSVGYASVILSKHANPIHFSKRLRGSQNTSPGLFGWQALFLLPFWYRLMCEFPATDLRERKGTGGSWVQPMADSQRPPCRRRTHARCTWFCLKKRLKKLFEKGLLIVYKKGVAHAQQTYRIDNVIEKRLGGFLHIFSRGIPKPDGIIILTIASGLLWITSHYKWK